MKYLFVSFLLLLSFKSIGQVEFISKKGSNYVYKNQVYGYDDLISLYENYLPSLKLYESALHLRQRSRNSFIAGLGLLAGGSGLILIGAEGPIGRGPNGLASFSVFTIIGGLIAGGIGAFQRLLSRKKLNKAKDVFNFYIIEQNGYDSSGTLNLRQSCNGIGLVMHF